MCRVLYGLGYGLALAAAWMVYAFFNIGWRLGAIIGGLVLLGVCLGKWLKWSRESGR